MNVWIKFEEIFRMNVGVHDLSKKSYSRKTVFWKSSKTWHTTILEKLLTVTVQVFVNWRYGLGLIRRNLVAIMLLVESAHITLITILFVQNVIVAIVVASTILILDAVPPIAVSILLCIIAATVIDPLERNLFHVWSSIGEIVAWIFQSLNDVSVHD